MNYHSNKEDRERRRRKLVSGMCGCKKNPAQIPWEGDKYCYECFHLLMKELRKIREE